jgi:hypothetical protein
MTPADTLFRSQAARALTVLCAIAGVGLALAGCTEPQLRTFNFFMEDKIAREGTILRCDATPEESQSDIECANARRAEATIALQLERQRLAELEAESERKIQELSRRIDDRERLAREAALEAVRAERERYEALWRELAGDAGVLPAEAAGATPPADSLPTDTVAN